MITWYLDFETEPIRPHPEYPPKPVGLAYAFATSVPKYVTSIEAMREVVKEAFENDVVFHNAGFDVAVAQKHLGLEVKDWTRVHDTMVLLFLSDPHAPDYKLKSAAERLLGDPPEERDAIVDWLVKHQPVEGVKLSAAPKSDNYAGAWVCKAPLKLLAKYAKGDIVRTRKLWKHLAPVRKSMAAAYAREQRMLALTLEMERHGVKVDVVALARDARTYTAAIGRCDEWLRRKLKVGGEFNLDSNAELAQALVKAGLAEEKDFGLTPTGQVATSKDALDNAVKDAQVLAMLRWRGAVGTCLRTFIEPWREQSTATGRIYIKWNSTRRDSGGGTGGARTGRFSSTPNLQNVPKVFKPLFAQHAQDPEKAKKLPKCPLVGLPDVPRVRSYVLPDDGHVLIDRDFSSQELRMLGYFEDGPIAEAFQANPDLDLHQKVADDVGVSRQQAKTLNFAILYGVGNGRLAEMLGTDVETARGIKMKYFAEYPSVQELIADLKAAAKSGRAIKTWGGRLYHVEPPKWVGDRLMDFSYKLLNYLIQGSSADLTKQTMLDFAAEAGAGVRILASVHDELLVSVTQARAAEVMGLLEKVMAAPRLGVVPMTSTGKQGMTWATMEKV